MKKRVRGKRRKISYKTTDSLFLAVDTRNYNHIAHYGSTAQNAHLIYIYIL